MIDLIKNRIKDAMKNKRLTELNVLRVALGDIQTHEARTKKDITEDQIHAVIKKIIKSNTETISVATDEQKVGTLRQENEILSSLLPQSWTAEQIYAYLTLHVLSPIQQAKSDGQATGISMKILKSVGAIVNGEDVSKVIKQIRNEYHA